MKASSVKARDVDASNIGSSESSHRGPAAAAVPPAVSRPRVLGASRATAAEALAASTATAEAPLKSLQEKLDGESTARISNEARNNYALESWDDTLIEFDDDGDSEMFAGGALSAAMQTSVPVAAQGNCSESQRDNGWNDTPSGAAPQPRSQQPDFLKNYIDQASHRRTQQLKKADAMLNKLLRPFPLPESTQASGKTSAVESESLKQPTTVELEALLSLCANQNSSFSSCSAGVLVPGGDDSSLEAGGATTSIPLFATADFQQLLSEVLNNSIRAIQIYDDFSGRFTDIELYSLAKVMPYNLSVEAITLSSLKESTWDECDDYDDDDSFDEAFLFGSSDDEFSSGGHVQTWRAPPQGGKKAGTPKQKAIISKECFMYFLESLTRSRVSFIDLSTSALYELMDDDVGETLAALAHTNPNLRTILLATTTKLKEYGMGGGTAQADEPVNPDDLHVEDVVANIKDEVLDEIDLVCQFNDSNAVERTRAQEAQPGKSSSGSNAKRKSGSNSGSAAANGGSRFRDSAALVDERRLKWECTSQLMPRLLQILNSKKLRINACVSYVLFDGSCPNSSESGDAADGGGSGCLLSHKPVGYVNHALDGFYHDVYLQKLEELQSAADPTSEANGSSDNSSAHTTSLRARAKKAQQLYERQQRYLNEAANYYAFTSTMGEKDVSSVGPSLPVVDAGAERKTLSLVQQFGTQNEWEKLLQQQQPKAGASWRADVPAKKGAAKKGGANASSPAPTVKLDLARLVPDSIPPTTTSAIPAIPNPAAPPTSTEDASIPTEPALSKSAAKRRRKAKRNAEAAAAAAKEQEEQRPSRFSRWKTDDVVLAVSVTMASVMVAVALGALLAERFSRKG